ncbi:MAG TPA: hypothetical protein VFO39_11905 [Candidatus Sulfotelmatobacter sp.]|nr:hypothetical protein [Candidatus Sulfotelmatobacter sp.]
MSPPRKQLWRKLRSYDAQSSGVDRLLSALRALDLTVVELSMDIYNVPQHDRAALLEQHRRLHDTVRERLPRFLCSPRRGA